jgi:hypothetical protein
MGNMPTHTINAISLLQLTYNEIADMASSVEAMANTIKAGFTDLLQSTAATYSNHAWWKVKGRHRESAPSIQDLQTVRV